MLKSCLVVLGKERVPDRLNNIVGGFPHDQSNNTVGGFPHDQSNNTVGGRQNDRSSPGIFFNDI